MGTGFTLDTPLRVARYGISSVISLVDDVIIEQSRKYHCKKQNIAYEPITARDPDARAKRITAYLNMLGQLVEKQVRELKAAPFEEGSDISRYFELLPPCPLRTEYETMHATTDAEEKAAMQVKLRERIVPGRIDVNIMTKLDADRFQDGKELPAEFADGMAALRGFATSDLSSAIVLSAGINQRLYTYAAQFDDFFHTETKPAKKKIILKVSDYRSALIQGKFLAKRGLWVSEFRIESGLNCGGHAFAGECNLLGPVLEQFKLNRNYLKDNLYKIYKKALASLGRPVQPQPPETRITVQGGIGTAHENNFLLKYYSIDGTGWGTPFMLVPEVTNVDQIHLEKLCNAKPEDIYLSHSSPMGIPFWNLRTSASEELRRERIEKGKPGSPCVKNYISLNTEFAGRPICTASKAYVTQKLAEIEASDMPEEQAELAREEVLEKSCICHDLGGAITLIQNPDEKAYPALCCGPNIRNFHRTFSLEEMVNHIYGRLCLLVNSERPHMFVEEMRLNLDYLKEEIRRFSHRFSNRPQSFFETFKMGLLDGIDYYQDLTKQFIDEQRDRFLKDLKKLQNEIEATVLPAG